MRSFPSGQSQLLLKALSVVVWVFACGWTAAAATSVRMEIKSSFIGGENEEYRELRSAKDIIERLESGKGCGFAEGF